MMTFDSLRGDELCAAERRLLQQGFGPGLEPRTEAVHDEQSRIRDSPRVSGGRLIELAIRVAADDRRQLHLVAGDAARPCRPAR